MLFIVFSVGWGSTFGRVYAEFMPGHKPTKPQLFLFPDVHSPGESNDMHVVFHRQAQVLLYSPPGGQRLGEKPRWSTKGQVVAVYSRVGAFCRNW